MFIKLQRNIFFREFGRSYEGREARERLKNFRKNYIEVMEHNKIKDPDYYLEINEFSDLVSCMTFEYQFRFRFLRISLYGCYFILISNLYTNA